MNTPLLDGIRKEAMASTFSGTGYINDQTKEASWYSTLLTKLAPWADDAARAGRFAKSVSSVNAAQKNLTAIQALAKGAKGAAKTRLLAQADDAAKALSKLKGTTATLSKGVKNMGGSSTAFGRGMARVKGKVGNVIRRGRARDMGKFHKATGLKGNEFTDAYNTYASQSAGKMKDFALMSGAPPPTTAIPPIIGSKAPEVLAGGGVSLAGGGTSNMLNWMAEHPRSAKALLAGGVIGGSVLGGGIYGGLVKNKAYKQGYGTATAQLSPMVSALHGPRGNIGRTPYGA